MKNLPLKSFICGLLLVTCGAGALVNAAEELLPPPTDTGTEIDVTLRAALDQLVEGVQARDDGRVDTTTCLDILAPTLLQRQAQLGLVSDAENPLMLEQFRQKYRDAVYTLFDDLLSRGQQVEAIETSRIEVRSPGDEENETLSISENPNALVSEITASGVLGVKLLTLKNPIDIDVSQINDRWCLNPVSVQ